MPTALERAGDFSQSVDLKRRPHCHQGSHQWPAFPNNVVPANRIDPNGQALLKAFPLPNFLDTSISARRYNYVFQENTRIRSARIQRAWITT